MKCSFLLGAVLSLAALVFGIPPAAGQTGGTPGQAGRYAGSSQQGQIGPYARELGYGQFGTYGSPYIPEYTYRAYVHIPHEHGPYAYMGYPRYSGYGYQSYPGRQYRWYGGRGPGWQGYRGYCGEQIPPAYRQSGYETRGYCRQPGWAWQRAYGYSGYSQPYRSGQQAGRGFSYQPYGYSGYRQQGYLNRGVSCRGGTCAPRYQIGWSRWYRQPCAYDWSGCVSGTCPGGYGTLSYRCGECGCR